MILRVKIDLSTELRDSEEAFPPDHQTGQEAQERILQAAAEAVWEQLPEGRQIRGKPPLLPGASVTFSTTARRRGVEAPPLEAMARLVALRTMREGSTFRARIVEAMRPAWAVLVLEINERLREEAQLVEGLDCDDCGGSRYVHHEPCSVPGCDHEEPCPTCNPTP